MRRIKLNRPPPVSSETVKDVVSDNAVVDSIRKKPQDVLTESQTGDVSAVGISADVEKCPNDISLITRKHIVAVKRDTQRVIKRKQSIVQDVHIEHSTAAPAVVQSLSDVPIASDPLLKEPETKQQHGNVVTQTGTVPKLLPGNDFTQSTCDEQHAVASTDNTVPGSVALRERKKPNKTGLSDTPSAHANSISTGSRNDIQSEGTSDTSFCDSSYSAYPSQDVVSHVEHEQSGLEGDKKQSGLLLDEALKRFLVKKLAVIESERKGTDVNSASDGVEAVVQDEASSISESSKFRRHKRLRESHEQRRDLEYLPVKVRQTDKTLHHGDKESTKTYCDADYTDSHQDNWSHFEHRHLPPHTLHGSAGHDVTKYNFGAQVISFESGNRKHKHSAGHSLHGKRHLLSSEEQKRRNEYKQQSYDFLQRDRNQYDEQKSFDCIEQVRQFVSYAAQFSHPVSQHHDPLESCYKKNTNLETHVRERQRSGNATSHQHHHHHHHHKKQKSAKHTIGDKMCRHKCVKHRGDKNRMQTTQSVQEAMSTKKKHKKRKHAHHHGKNISEGADPDSKKLDRGETLHQVQPKDKDNEFSKSRSLSPLGLHRKHHKKHMKKKSSEKNVSQISTQNALLPEKIDAEYDKISSDDEFVPMKVQKNEDDGDAVSSKVPVLHRSDMPNTVAVEQGNTSSKPALGTNYKFLKVSGKRPKRQTRVSGTDHSAEVQMSEECAPVEECAVQAAAGDQFQMTEVTATDHVTTEETLTPLVAAVQDYAGQTGTAHEGSAPADLKASEQVNSCSDADDRVVLPTMADKVSDEVSSEMNILSTDAMSMTSQKGAVATGDSDNTTESKNDHVHDLGESEQQETTEESSSITKKLPTHDDGDCTSKIVLSDTASGEELKSLSEQCVNDETETETSAEFNADTSIEPDGVCEKASAEVQYKHTEKVRSEELEAVMENAENITDQHSDSSSSVTLSVNCPLQLNQTSGTEVLATADIIPVGGNSPITTKDTTENISSCNADEKVGDSHTALPCNLMGPPLALPPSAAFKKPPPVRKLNVRITDTSADFISSGAKKCEKQRKARNDESREEGKQVW